MALAWQAGWARWSRAFSSASGSPVLSKWLKGWTATPPVVFAPGTEPPTALSWLRRRGPPGLPIAAIHRLFREGTVRAYEPSTGQVTRAARGKQLRPGALLLLPHGFAEGAGPQEPAAARALSPEQDRLRAAWVRRLRGRLLYDGMDFLAIDKPAGLAVQGGRGLPVSVDSVMGEAFGGPQALDPGQLRLVHRLDQGTTGVLLLAKSADAAAWLGGAFRAGAAAAAEEAEAAEAEAPRRGPGGRQRRVRPSGPAAPAITKTYWAVLAAREGQRLPRRGRIDAPIAASGGGFGSTAAPLPALTQYRVLAQGGGLAWLELRPLTGRKHQLRIHAAQGLGAPILGDARHGSSAFNGGSREREAGGSAGGGTQAAVLEAARAAGAWEGPTPPLFLHCRSVEVSRPDLPAPIRVEAPLPDHWELLLRQLKWRD